MAKCGWCKRTGLEKRENGDLVGHTRPRNVDEIVLNGPGNSNSTCKGPEDYYDSKSS